MLEFFRAPVTRCSERAGRMVQHLPPQPSYASVVLVASESRHLGGLGRELTYMGVEPNIAGFSPKMDGENNGKAY